MTSRILSMSGMSGFICPNCVVTLPSAEKLQSHWLEFHAEDIPGQEGFISVTTDGTSSAPQQQQQSDPTSASPEPPPPPPAATPAADKNSFEILGKVCQSHHQLVKANLSRPRACKVCHQIIWSDTMSCELCAFHCHLKCVQNDSSLCGRASSGLQSPPRKPSPSPSANETRAPQPDEPRGIVSKVRHKVSRGRARYMDESFDLDLCYITERLIAMSFPSAGVEATYRNNLNDVARMLKLKHKENYMVFNVSERSYDVSKLNHQVLDFGWPDHLAPPLDRLCSICKSIDSWLKFDAQNVAVVHCKGGKGRTGVVVAAYMHYSNQHDLSAEAALDLFAMKRFYDDRGKVSQPSQRRLVRYFESLLKGDISFTKSPVYLVAVLIHGIPNFDGHGYCRPYLRVYQDLKVVYTSDILSVGPGTEADTKKRIVFEFPTPLVLNGDIMIRCFHKRATGHEVIFRVQFHTCAATREQRMVLAKSDLDDAHSDRRFLDSARVEFIFQPPPVEIDDPTVATALSARYMDQLGETSKPPALPQRSNVQQQSQLPPPIPGHRLEEKEPPLPPRGQRPPLDQLGGQASSFDEANTGVVVKPSEDSLAVPAGQETGDTLIELDDIQTAIHGSLNAVDDKLAAVEISRVNSFGITGAILRPQKHPSHPQPTELAHPVQHQPAQPLPTHPVQHQPAQPLPTQPAQLYPVKSGPNRALNTVNPGYESVALANQRSASSGAVSSDTCSAPGYRAPLAVAAKAGEPLYREIQQTHRHTSFAIPPTAHQRRVESSRSVDSIGMTPHSRVPADRPALTTSATSASPEFVSCNGDRYSNVNKSPSRSSSSPKVPVLSTSPLHSTPTPRHSSSGVTSPTSSSGTSLHPSTSGGSASTNFESGRKLVVRKSPGSLDSLLSSINSEEAASGYESLKHVFAGIDDRHNPTHPAASGPRRGQAQAMAAPQRSAGDLTALPTSMGKRSHRLSAPDVSHFYADVNDILAAKKLIQRSQASPQHDKPRDDDDDAGLTPKLPTRPDRFVLEDDQGKIAPNVSDVSNSFEENHFSKIPDGVSEVPANRSRELPPVPDTQASTLTPSLSSPPPEQRKPVKGSPAMKTSLISETIGFVRSRAASVSYGRDKRAGNRSELPVKLARRKVRPVSVADEPARAEPSHLAAGLKPSKSLDSLISMSPSADGICAAPAHSPCDDELSNQEASRLTDSLATGNVAPVSSPGAKAKRRSGPTGIEMATQQLKKFAAMRGNYRISLGDKKAGKKHTTSSSTESEKNEKPERPTFTGIPGKADLPRAVTSPSFPNIPTFGVSSEPSDSSSPQPPAGDVATLSRVTIPSEMKLLDHTLSSDSPANNNTQDRFFQDQWHGNEFPKSATAASCRSFWLKKNISREDATSLLTDRPIGTFLMRESRSSKDAYSLSMRAAPDGSALIKHYLLEPSEDVGRDGKPGVHLRLTSEAAFESLDEFVEAHLIAPLALPCRLILPRSDWIDEANDETGGRSKTSKIPSSPGWKSKFSAAASDGWHRSSSQHVKSPTAMRTRPVKTSMSVAEKLETKSDDPDIVYTQLDFGSAESSPSIRGKRHDTLMAKITPEHATVSHLSSPPALSPSVSPPSAPHGGLIEPGLLKFAMVYLGSAVASTRNWRSAMVSSYEQVTARKHLKSVHVSLMSCPEYIALMDDFGKMLKFDMSSVLHCSLDPFDRRFWISTTSNVSIPSGSTSGGRMQERAVMGVIVRKSSPDHKKVCHLFAPLDHNSMASVVVDTIQTHLAMYASEAKS